MRRYGSLEQHEQVELLNWFKQICLPRIPSEGDRAKILESIERGEEVMIQYTIEREFNNARLEGLNEGLREGERKG